MIKARLHSVKGSCGCFYKVSEKVRGKQKSLRCVMAPNPKCCWRYFLNLCYVYLCFLNKCKNYNWKECSFLNKLNLRFFIWKKKKKEKSKTLEKFWHEGDESWSHLFSPRTGMVLLQERTSLLSWKDHLKGWKGTSGLRSIQSLASPLRVPIWVPVSASQASGFMMWTGIQQGLDWVNIVLIKFFWSIKLY